MITLMPGGPAERWPAAHFGLLAKNLISSLNAVVLLAGDRDDMELCTEVAQAAGPDAINLAGQITLPEWAALLTVSDCAVCNAGGSMQLVAATGTPVVPVCGLSDPTKNPSLGPFTRFDEKKAPSAEPEFEEVTRTLTAVTTDLAYGLIAKAGMPDEKESGCSAAFYEASSVIGGSAGGSQRHFRTPRLPAYGISPAHFTGPRSCIPGSTN